MNCPLESDQIRNWFGLFVQFSFRGKTTGSTHPVFFLSGFVSLVTLIDLCGHDRVSYVSRYRSYPPLRRRSLFPLVLSDGPIPSPNHFPPLFVLSKNEIAWQIRFSSSSLSPHRRRPCVAPLMRGTVRLIPIVHYPDMVFPHRVVWGYIQYSIDAIIIHYYIVAHSSCGVPWA